MSRDSVAWVDSMRLRRYASRVRTLGWINLCVTVAFSFGHAHSSSELAALGIGASWAITVMAITHGIAWMIDKRAEQVVTR